MPPIAKKINELRTVFILDPPIINLTCYKCFERTARVVIQHFSETDYIPICPKLVEFAPHSHLTQWCLECLFRCQNFGKETIEFVKQNISAENCPSNDELDELTLIEEDQKKLELQEQQCCCKRHIRLCHPYASINESHEDNEIYNKFNEFQEISTNCDDKIKGSIGNIFSPVSPNEKIGKWLIWVGDYESRNKKMCALISKYYENDPPKADNWLQLIVYAAVFEIKTRCDHILPKPYTHCTCNFSITHYQRLINDLDCGNLIH